MTCLLLLGFLELINNMLTSGMVPALFPDDEKEGILNAVRRRQISIYVLRIIAFIFL